MSVFAEAPEGLRELAETVGLEPLKPLLFELDAELAGFVADPPCDLGDLAKQAHGLVGAGGGIGFTDLAERCRLLEQACKTGRDTTAPLAAAQAHARDARAVIATFAS